MLSGTVQTPTDHILHRYSLYSIEYILNLSRKSINPGSYSVLFVASNANPPFRASFAQRDNENDTLKECTRLFLCTGLETAT